MKKLLISGLILFSLSLNAQTRITKSSVVGKWTISSMEMPSLLYYNVEKDSIAIGELMKSQVKNDQQMVELKTMIKQQVAIFIKTAFVFNADGTAELINGEEAAQKDTYTVNEENSTIITAGNGKDKQEEIQKAEMLGDKLRITSKQPQGEVVLVLAKAK